MKRRLSTKQIKTLVPYFLLALAVIISYKVISEIHVVIYALKKMLNTVSPFLNGFLLAYVLNIPRAGIYRVLSKTGSSLVRRKAKLLSTILTYLLFFVLIFLLLSLIIPAIYENVSLFLSNFQTYYMRLQDLVDQINSMDLFLPEISLVSVKSLLPNFSMDNLTSSVSAIFGVSTVLFSWFLTLIASIYILAEKENFKKYLCRLLRVFFTEKTYTLILRYSRELNINFRQYVYTQTIDGCILGTIATIELILLRSPYALLLGIMLGIVNYIPYFGSIFGSMMAVVIVLLTQNLPTAVLAGIILLITQQIDGNVLQPRLLGGSFSLSPLLVIVSITIGGSMGGILGMIAAIPIVAVLKNIMEDIIIYYEEQKRTKSDPQITD